MEHGLSLTDDTHGPYQCRQVFGRVEVCDRPNDDLVNWQAECLAGLWLREQGRGIDAVMEGDQLLPAGKTETGRGQAVKR